MLRLASLGGGRGYQANEFTNVPKIFTKETMLAGGSYVQNRVFTPVVTENAALTAFEGFPALAGYLAATEKPTATVSMVSDTDDPLLARWNVGAGKALAWTSDAEGAWTDGFLRWEQAPSFFGGMVSAVLPGAGREGVLTAEATDDKLRIAYTVGEGAEAADGERELTTVATVLLPDGTEQSVTLAQVGEGAYEGELAAGQQGAYSLRVAQSDAEGELRSQESGAVKSYAREYDLRGRSADSLTALTERTGGRMLSSAEAFWDTPVQGARARRSLQRALLIAALLLLLIDIALRKLPWEDAALALLQKRGAQRGRKPREEADADGNAARERNAEASAQTKTPRNKRKREQENHRQEAAAQTAAALLNAQKARKGGQDANTR